MEFLFQYTLFLAETVTIVAAIALVLAIAVTSSRRNSEGEQLVLKDLSENHENTAVQMRFATMTKKAFKADQKSRKKQIKTTPPSDKIIYVIDFKGDVRANAVVSLREEITALLTTATKGDEVILRLENAGGTVHEHGLAASQLLRLRTQGIHLTACVDKIAASGGYLMACAANRIIAAPFAILGSIGVLVALPNFHRLLEHHGVDFEQFKGGKHKRTITMFGENTDADRDKLREEIDSIHEQFKTFVTTHRPQLDMDKVATGEHWLGQQALDLGLCDAIGTSDDTLLEAGRNARLLHLAYQRKSSFTARLGIKIRSFGRSIIDRLADWRQQT